jgi:hypothetical protein
MKYKFIKDYTSNFGVVKAGQELTGKKITVPLVLPNSKIPQQVPSVVFDYMEITDPSKSTITQEGVTKGDNFFPISETVLKDYAKYVETTGGTVIGSTNSNKSSELTTTTPSTGWKSWSKNKKALVVVSSAIAIGFAVWYFGFKKK